MKKTIIAALAAVIIGVCTSVQAAGYPPVEQPVVAQINPVDVARAFALKTPANYYGQFSARVVIGEGSVWMNMSFMMRPGDFAITNLVINDINIPLPEPVYGLPMGENGFMQDVNLSVYATTQLGEYAGDGYLYKQEVSFGDSLVVTLMPAPIRVAIPLNSPVQSWDGVRIDIENFPYGYGWGVQDGQLFLWMPPVGGQYSYVVRDANGIVIGSGTIDSFHATDPANEAYVGVGYAGNVAGMQFPQPSGYDSWTWLPLAFDCSIPTTVDPAGPSVMGKVLFVDVGTGGLELIISGEYWVYVQHVTGENGDMAYLPLEDHSVSGQDWYQTQVNTTSMNVGKVVVTIIPKTKLGYKPYLNLHRFYGKPGGGQG